jgi:DNA-binding beta-propeller fold protein YncE
VSNSGTGGVSRISVSSAGSTGVTAGTSVAGGGQTGQQGITLDKNGDVWVANENASNGSVTKITGSTATVVLGPLAVGGINSTSQPWGITTDSANNVWVNNFNNNSVSELDTNGNALSPAGGFTAGGLIKFPRNGISVDRSGNVWVLNDDFPPAFVTVLLGAASPVATPRSSGRPSVP